MVDVNEEVKLRVEGSNLGGVTTVTVHHGITSSEKFKATQTMAKKTAVTSWQMPSLPHILLASNECKRQRKGRVLCCA